VVDNGGAGITFFQSDHGDLINNTLYHNVKTSTNNGGDLVVAYAADVLVQNNNSDPVDLGPNHVAVLRISEHKPATPIPLDQVRGTVREKIIAERAAKDSKTRADAVFAQLTTGTTLDALAATNKLKVEDQKGVGRAGATVDSALVNAAFSMPRPAAGKPSQKLVELGGDIYALVQLDAVVDGDPSKLDAKTREAARNTLVQGAGTSASHEFVEALRKGTKIKLSEDRMQDL